MSLRLRLPFLVDVLLLDEPERIRALVAREEVDRDLRARGPLLNRYLQAQVLKWFELDGQVLVSLRPRADRERAANQQAIAALLQNQDALFEGPITGELAAIVRGEGDPERIGPLVQGAVGALFDPDYRADRVSYDAAKTIEKAPIAPPWTALWWAITGKARKAKALLWAKSKRRAPSIHATVIGFHHVVHSIEALRRIHASSYERGLTTPENAAQRSLSAPPIAPRRVVRAFVDESGARHAEDALILCQVAKAFAKSGQVDDAFFADAWSACPARAFAPLWLGHVWRRATLDEKEAA